MNAEESEEADADRETVRIRMRDSKGACSGADAEESGGGTRTYRPLRLRRQLLFSAVTAIVLKERLIGERWGCSCHVAAVLLDVKAEKVWCGDGWGSESSVYNVPGALIFQSHIVRTASPPPVRLVSGSLFP